MGEVWFAPDDPSLPMPWKGIVDGNTGCLYYWNPGTNITQYEKPAYWVSSPSLSASCSPGPTVSDYNLHSQYPNLYPHYEAPAETVINGYTFPTQFPFPNHTHTPNNQPINPQSQSTDYHYHSLTHPPIAHPSYHLPPFATSAYPSESDYGYLSSLPNLSDQPFSCIPYSTSPHNPSYSAITYSHTTPKESIVPPSTLAYTAGGTSSIEKDNVLPSDMKKSLRRNLKMRSHVMMKRKPKSQFPRRRRTQNNGGSEGDWCKASSLMAVNWDSTVPFDKSVNSLSELTVLDLVVKSGSTSVSSKDAPLFFPGDKKKAFLRVEVVYGQMLGPDEFCNSGRAKDLLILADFQRIKDNSGGPLVDWELKSIDMELARFYFNLSLEKTIMNSGHILAEVEQNAIVIHFCNLVVVNHFSLVTNFLSGLNPILLSMSFVESPVILEVSIAESYEHGSKHEAGKFDKFMVCSFTVELKKTLRVAHLQATLSDWKIREKNVVSGSTGGFEYDVHRENLTRNSQQLCVNMNGKGIESNCSVMYHLLPYLNWNQAFPLGQEINFQQNFSYLRKGLVHLQYNLCFFAEIRFLGLITSIVHLGPETIMHTSSHAWDLQFHKLQTCWITFVHAFSATLSHGLNKGSLVVVLGIHSGTIDLPSLVILNGHSEVMVTSCHLLGGKYCDHVWLYFLTNKDQGVKAILIAMENLVQCLSFMFDLKSQNVIVIFIINQPLIVQQLFSLRFDTAVVCLLILFAKLILIICGMTHKNLDGAALPNALWSAPICKDIIQLQLHSTVIISFLLGMVSTRTRSDTHTFRYYSGSHSSLASINMKLQVYPILYDLGLQKHGHELNYLFVACVVLALFLLVATMLIKDVNGGHFYLIEVVVVIHEVLFDQLRRFFVKVIDYLQGNSEFFPMSYSSGPIILLPTIDIQSLMRIMFQDGLLMTHEHGRGIDKSTLLIPPLFALGVRWFPVQCFLNQLLALLFADTSTVFESVSVNSITKLVTLKYKKETLDVNFPSAIFYVAFLFFSLLQLIEKFRPTQLVESPRYCMSKQEILATFWLCLPRALSSLGDWVFILQGLIVIWVHVLISNTILLGELKFDHESHITPTGTIATGLVLPFGENSRGAFFQYGCSTHKDTKIKLSECLTFYGGALSLNTTVMICICVDQSTLKSTAQTLWLDATAQKPLIVNPKDVVVQSGILILSTFKFIFTLVMGNKIIGIDGIIEEVLGKVTIHEVIPFILLTNGSWGCWNAKNAKAKDFHAQMRGEGIQSRMRLPTEDPSTVADQLNTTWMQLKDNWFNYPPTTISRHEDMPSFKGGGMIGSLG